MRPGALLGAGCRGLNAHKLLQAMNAGGQLPDVLKQLLEFRFRYHLFAGKMPIAQKRRTKPVQIRTFLLSVKPLNRVDIQSSCATRQARMP
jgi:hypothetical protein